uniref:Uncharacterized protein n=1 Tax=Cacopsylla melanoneura TaxID=428564 RepID=A0A8D8V1Z7_9HEMI
MFIVGLRVIGRANDILTTEFKSLTEKKVIGLRISQISTCLKKLSAVSPQAKKNHAVKRDFGVTKTINLLLPYRLGRERRANNQTRICPKFSKLNFWARWKCRMSS